ncbi:MAG: hypothetical protein AB7F96_20750 [Beijerinckiaceae bacterium]
MSSGQDGKTETQLTLDLPVAPRFGREDFLLAPSNRAAFELVERWPDWPAHIVALAGPEGAGKSHLGAIWAERAHAAVAAARDLRVEDVPALANAGTVLLEDTGQGAIPERALFHLINAIREAGGYLLLTCRTSPAEWNVAIPDLKSRLRLAPVAEIGAPGDDLVRAVLMKLFVDRQLTVDAPVIDFLMLRIERSLAAARRIVELLDREALARGRAVTRPMASEVLASETRTAGDANVDAPGDGAATSAAAG